MNCPKYSPVLDKLDKAKPVQLDKLAHPLLFGQVRVVVAMRLKEALRFADVHVQAPENQQKSFVNVGRP